MAGTTFIGTILAQATDPSPSPSPTQNAFPAASFGADMIFYVEIGILILILGVIVTPWILSKTQSSFFSIPFITWYLLHFGIGVVTLLTLLALGLAGSLSAPLIAIYAGLLGVIFGAAAASKGQTDPTAAKTLSLKSVTPGSGAAGTVLTLIGAGFDPKATVTVGSADLTNVHVSADGSMLVGTLPASQMPGTALSVAVQNPTGPSSTLAGAFTYSS
jgi:hypothetical protein